MSKFGRPFRQLVRLFGAALMTAALLFACGSGSTSSAGGSGSAAAVANVRGGPKLDVAPRSTVAYPVRSSIVAVAAENFYGDILRQIGGSDVDVTSILTDPSVDPHDYQSTVGDAKAVAHASLVVANGDGYDPWMDKLLAGSPLSGRIVIKGYDAAVRKLPDNEHVWYGLDNAEAIANAISGALAQLDPGHAGDFEANLTRFQSSLNSVRNLETDIRNQYDGTPVALTETIFRYQTSSLGLNVITPLPFEQAIAEGYDPPAQSLITAQEQIRKKQARVLIYNSQTADSITERLRSEAAASGIPVVAVTETMPAGKDYQSWMLGQLQAIQAALRSVEAPSR